MVTDNNESVAKDVDSPVLVSRPPELEVVPSALVLPQVGNRITADIQQATIFCYVQEIFSYGLKIFLISFSLFIFNEYQAFLR